MNMKFTSIFFTTSESIFENYLKDTNKRVINIKFTSIFLWFVHKICKICISDTYFEQT